MLREQLGVSIWARMGPNGPDWAQTGPIGHFGRMPKMPKWAVRANAKNVQLGPFGPVRARLGPISKRSRLEIPRLAPLEVRQYANNILCVRL